MALSIKSLNGMNAIKKLGVDADAVAWLEAAPIKVALNAKEFVFSLPENVNGGQVFTVAAPLSNMQKLAMGTLPESAKLTIRLNIEQTIDHIRLTYGDDLVALPTSAVAEAQQANLMKPVSTLTKLPPLKANLSDETVAELSAIADAPKKKGMWLPFPEEQMTKAPLIKLRDANQMYQPVLGTSAGSRYYVVAANADIRVAARYLPGKLSVRIEGTGLAKYQKAISGAGIDVHSGKDYASVHLQVGTDPVLANKTLGAVLLGLGIELDTPFPQLQKIANK